jgi:HEAT repeat protein
MMMTGATRQDAVMRTSVEERLAVIAGLELRRDDASVDALLDFAVSAAVEDAVRAVAQRALARRLGALDLAQRLGARLIDAPVATRRVIVQAIVTHGDLRSVPWLLAALEDPDEDVRRISVRGLGQLGSAGVADELLSLLDDPGVALRLDVCRTLARIGGEAGHRALARLIEDPSARLREEVCILLREQPDAAHVGALLGRLGDPKERSEVRFKAVEALSAARDPNALPALIAALGDADSAVRSTAAWCLGVFKAPEAFEPLVAYLFADMDGEYAHAGAAISLGLSGDPRALAPLKKALDDEREAVRQWAAEGLGHLKIAQAVPPLVLALEDVSEAVRESAARSLGRLADPSALPNLTAALVADEVPIRAAAAEAIGAIGSPEGIEGLMEATASDLHERVRAAAAEALGRLGVPSPEVARRLLHLLSEESLSVRRAAATALATVAEPGQLPGLRTLIRSEPRLTEDAPTWISLITARARLGDEAAREALWRLAREDQAESWRAAVGLAKIGDPRAVEPNVRLLRAREWSVKFQAIHALATLRSAAAIPGLRERLRDRTPAVREAAARAIAEIEGA